MGGAMLVIAEQAPGGQLIDFDQLAAVDAERGILGRASPLGAGGPMQDEHRRARGHQPGQEPEQDHAGPLADRKRWRNLSLGVTRNAPIHRSSPRRVD